jgi:hypothetical protein
LHAGPATAVEGELLKMMVEAAKFSVLWEDQASQDKPTMHMTGFADELAARRFALGQRN